MAIVAVLLRGRLRTTAVTELQNRLLVAMALLAFFAITAPSSTTLRSYRPTSNAATPNRELRCQVHGVADLPHRGAAIIVGADCVLRTY